MPIAFARCNFIQRSKGHSVLMAAVYIARTRLAAPYPPIDYSARGDVLFPMRTLLPENAPKAFEDPWFLWSEMEKAAPRKDASLGLHLMLALPAPDELPAQLCLELVESFIQTLIVPHGLASSYALHEAHHEEKADNMGWLEPETNRHSNGRRSSDRNRHAHVIISGRRLVPTGIENRRYKAFDPSHGNIGGPRGGIDWPQLWMQHQNAFFFHRGLGLRVRPLAKFADLHHGSRQAVLKWKRQTEVLERANRAAISDPSQFLELMSSRPFTKRDLKELVERYTPKAHPFDLDSADALLAMPNVVQLAYPDSAIRSPWFVTTELVQAEQDCIKLTATLVEKGNSQHPEDSSTLDGRNGTVAIVEMSEALQAELSAKLANPDDPTIEAVHGWPSALGEGFKVEIRRAAYSLRPGSVVVLDHADALTTFALRTLLESVLLTENVQLVMVRRPSALTCLRSPLLDILASKVDPEHDPTSVDAEARLSFRTKVEELANEGRIVFSDRAGLLAKAKELYRKEKDGGKSSELICPHYELSALLAFNKLPVKPIASEAEAILIHCEPTFGNLPLLGLLKSIKNPILLVDRSYCPSLSDLHRQIDQLGSLPCATVALRHDVTSRHFAANRPALDEVRTGATPVDGAVRPAEHLVGSHAPRETTGMRSADTFVARKKHPIQPADEPEDDDFTNEADFEPDSPEDLRADRFDDIDAAPDFDADFDPADDFEDFENWPDHEVWSDGIEETPSNGDD